MPAGVAELLSTRTRLPVDACSDREAPAAVA
jgi:hypothetical protein